MADSFNDFTPKSFAVIGAGPSGCVLAAFLARGGYDVTLCDILTDLIKPAVDRGIILEGCENFTQPVLRICSTIEDLKNINPDVIFVATKTNALPIVSESIAKVHQEGTYVVSWQNGIDTEESLLEGLSKQWIMRAVVNYGCSLIAPAHAHIAFHHAPHYIQDMEDIDVSRNAAKVITRIMTECGLKTNHTEDIKSMVWRKAILNAAMNPVCALTGLTMYEAMRESYIFDIVDSLLKECISVAKINGIKISEEYYQNAISYMRNAGNHKPSMLMDIENKRNTEIEYINGNFEKYGLSLGVSTPYNSTLKALVKGLEFNFSKI